ncbi:MAG: hypothetical protein F4X99_18425 [Gammaproteobacteria bacterium]|nr:hypothetical protein [Gammaproteobacteria bacterium]
MRFDLIVQNGTVIDGTGNDRFGADLGIKNGTIVGGAEDKVRKAADPDFRRRMRENYDPAVMIPAGGPIDTWLLVDARGSERFARY